MYFLSQLWSHFIISTSILFSFIHYAILSFRCFIAITRFNCFKIFSLFDCFNCKTARGDSIWPSLWFFEKCIFEREGKALVFVNFNITISHIFPKDFIWNLSSRKEIINNFSVNIRYFHLFSGFFELSLLQKN